MPIPAHALLMAAGGEAAWTPSELDGVSLRFWYDAADTSTIEFESGDAVLTIEDKSAYGYILERSGTGPSSGLSTLNGRNVLDFSAGSSTLLINRTDASTEAEWRWLNNGTAVFCVSMVCKPGVVSDPNAFYTLWATDPTASGADGITVWFDDRAASSRNNRLAVQNGIGGNVSNMSADDVCTPNTWHIITVLGDADNATASLRSSIYVDGGAAIANNALTAAAPTGNVLGFRVGGTTGSTFLTGSIAEIVGTDNQSDRTLVEAYLADKWGL